MVKNFTLLQLFSLVDGRLSTNMSDIYEMLDHICDNNLMTHNLPVAMDYLKMKNPKWFQETSQKLSDIEMKLETSNFESFMVYIQENNEIINVPQLKDEIDTSDFSTYMIENSLFIPLKEKRKLKLEKIEKNTDKPLNN